MTHTDLNLMKMNSNLYDNNLKKLNRIKTISNNKLYDHLLI